MTIAFWNGRHLYAWDTQGEEIANLNDAQSGQEESDHEAESRQRVIPSWVSDQSPPDMLIWSVEHLLSRPFSLPLAHPRLLDINILGQELAGQAGIEPDAWWLSWNAHTVEEGVAGLVFGMPITVQAALAGDTSWQGCRFIGVDAWFRLTTCVPDDHAPDYAVVDADAEGLFVGVYRSGAWRGLRRLNLLSACSCSAMADHAMRSMQAMGFNTDVMPVYGYMDATWYEALAHAMPHWQGKMADALPDRATATHQAAMRVSETGAPNFRHGAWTVAGAWKKRLRPWRRTAVMASVLLLLVLGGNFYHMHQLKHEQMRIQTGIEAAFHRGLPDEKVMLDPMAQLRKAVGGSGSGDVWFFMRQLQAVGTLQQKVKGLRIVSLQYTGKTMQLSGTVPDLASVNRVRDSLSSILGQPVKVEDTELANQQVRFRIQWAGVRA